MNMTIRPSPFRIALYRPCEGIRILAATGLLYLLFSSGLQAQSQPWGFDYSQYPPVRHNVPLIRQDTMVWCWVAVAEMVARYSRHDVPSQCEMLSETYGAPCCTNAAACMRPGHIVEIQNLLQRYGGRLSTLAPPADGFSLYNALRRGPVVLATTQGGGHFVVATGMRVVPTQIGPLGVVAINDPFFGPYELSFPELAQIWQAALLANE